MAAGETIHRGPADALRKDSHQKDKNNALRKDLDDGARSKAGVCAHLQELVNLHTARTGEAHTVTMLKLKACDDAIECVSRLKRDSQL